MIPADSYPMGTRVFVEAVCTDPTGAPIDATGLASVLRFRAGCTDGTTVVASSITVDTVAGKTIATASFLPSKPGDWVAQFWHPTSGVEIASADRQIRITPSALGTLPA